MTLAQRVAAAESRTSASSLTQEAQLLEELKEGVGRIIPPASLSAMAFTNPKRARSELRQAAQQCFASSSWAYRSADVRSRLLNQLEDSVFGLGPLQDLVEDDEITEIMVNATDSIYVERGGVLNRHDALFYSNEQLRAIVDRIIAPLGRRVDESSPMVDARLANGFRVNVVVPPISAAGPVLTIRKFSRHVITLEEMRQAGSMDQAIKSLLEWMVLCRKNAAVCGGTGSGKTTLLNALSSVIDHGERIVTIEDSAELRFDEHPHVVSLEARVPNAEGVGEVSIRDLVRNSLRMRPDRIIVGECRGAEALDMLQAMNTGHEGSLTTLHANSPQDMVNRLVAMVRFGSDLPVDVIEDIIASALDVVVQVARHRNGKRFVSGLAQVEKGSDGGCEVRALYERRSPAEQGVWHGEPPWIEEAVQSGLIDRGEVQRWRLACGLCSVA
ncbi:MAG: CpaF family protein [Eggerthellales bacterium]|nr:CpaF family protein [Eggerthellales bacterium]